MNYETAGPFDRLTVLSAVEGLPPRHAIHA